MINIAFCDNDSPDCARARDIIAAVAGETDTAYRMDVFHDAESFLFEAKEDRYQIILLGTDVGGVSGLSLAKTLRGNRSKAILLFLSDSDKYALASYDVSAFFYFLYPPDEARFSFVFHRLFNMLSAKAAKAITLKKGAKYFSIPVSSVKYVSSVSHYVNVNRTGGGTESFAMKLDDFESLCSEYGVFIRIHKSYLVNYKYIRFLTPTEAELDGETLPVSRSLKNSALEKYARLCGKGKK